jgi:hypothetical protein
MLHSKLNPKPNPKQLMVAANYGSPTKRFWKARSHSLEAATRG